MTELLGPTTGDTAGVFITDQLRTVVSWDEGMERLLGFTAKEIVGEHCLKGNRCSNCIQECGLERMGSVVRAPLTLFHENGTEVQLWKTGRALFGDDGSFMGTIEIMSVRTADDEAPTLVPGGTFPCF